MVATARKEQKVAMVGLAVAMAHGAENCRADRGRRDAVRTHRPTSDLSFATSQHLPKTVASSRAGIGRRPAGAGTGASSDASCCRRAALVAEKTSDRICQCCRCAKRPPRPRPTATRTSSRAESSQRATPRHSDDKLQSKHQPSPDSNLPTPANRKRRVGQRGRRHVIGSIRERPTRRAAIGPECTSRSFAPRCAGTCDSRARRGMPSRARRGMRAAESSDAVAFGSSCQETCESRLAPRDRRHERGGGSSAS